MPSNLERLARRKRQTRLTFDAVDENASPANKMSPAKVRYQKTGKQPVKQTGTPTSSFQIIVGQSDSDDILSSGQKAATTPTRRTSGRNKTAAIPTRALPTPVKSSQAIIDIDSSDGSAPEVDMLHTRKVEKVLFPSSSKRTGKIQKIVESDDSDEEPLTSPLKRRRVVIESDDDDSDIVSSPMKRRRPATQLQDDEEEEEEEHEANDDEALPIRKPELRKRRHRSDKEKKLELLKRKRAGENIEEVTDSSSDSDKPRVGIYDSDANSDLHVLSDFEDEESGIETTKAHKVKNATKSGRGKKVEKEKKKNENEYDSDFVVDDEDGPLGVPVGLMDIPLEFTHQAHKPLKEHFRDAVEWMVHNKINPAFSRDDPIYRQAFAKLDNEYGGYAKSKFVSTQWTAEFTRAIFARPMLIERHPLEEGEGITVEGVYKCDACNHRKHVPTYGVSFHGKPYNIETLEDIADDSDDSEDSDDSDANSDGGHKDYDQNGYVLPPEEKEWYAGVTCFTNAQHAHTLIHWKKALNSWVIDNLEVTGELTPEKLASRDQMSAKKRLKYANKLVDQWEREATISQLYRDFKSQLEAARDAQASGRWERRRTQQ